MCPILTSFSENGSVSYDDMHAMYDQILDAGIDGILVGGSSGEFYALNFEEVQSLIKDAVQYINHKGFVLAGTGRMMESETIHLSNFALDNGADAVIVVGPYYTACNEEDVFHYYDHILSGIYGKVYIYNYIERTGYDVTVNTMLRLLAKHNNLAGVKDTHMILRHTQRYIQEVKSKYPNFQVFTGYDNHCIPVILSGGDGCIGALSNVFPELGCKVVEALKNENIAELITLQRSIDKYMKMYELHTPFNPVMKWVMKQMGKPMQEYCSEPLTPLSDKEKEVLFPIVKELF